MSYSLLLIGIQLTEQYGATSREPVPTLLNLNLRGVGPRDQSADNRSTLRAGSFSLRANEGRHEED